MAQNANSLLLNEPPILIQPSLAKVVGLNEAIVLQQLHYWLQKSTNERDGRRWVYNTTKDWAEQFPFWSEDTIKRIMRGLRDQGIVVTATYNQMAIDRTLWYSVDYEKLDAIVRNRPSIRASCTNGLGQVAPTNNHRLPETNTSSSSDGAESHKEEKPEPKFKLTDEELAAIFRCWHDNMPGMLTPILTDEIKDWGGEYGAAAVIKAITAAVIAGVRKPSYVNGILEREASGEDRKPKESKQYQNGGGRAGNKDADPDTQRANAMYGERKKVVVTMPDLPDDPGF